METWLVALTVIVVLGGIATDAAFRRINRRLEHISRLLGSDGRDLGSGSDH